MIDAWNDFGFRQNPYATSPVPPTDEGDRLLVGREQEARQLTNRIISSGSHPTVEGDNGVGKTSLVSVVGYRLFMAFKQGASSQAIIPLDEPFQLSASETDESFLRKIYFAIVRKLNEHRRLLNEKGLSVPDTSALEKWINSAIFTTRGAGAQAFGVGGSASRGATPNSSSGFNESGFISTVDKWLRACFPTNQRGSFLCVIDNLELLETSEAVRLLLESMRDTVLGKHGLRWVLCGARGIVRTGAASPRLEGRLAEPIGLTPIRDEEVRDVLIRRIDLYRTALDGIAPVDPEGFRFLYDILNRNLRTTLKYSEDFALWLYDNGDIRLTARKNRQLLEEWIARQADLCVKATTRVKPRAWRVFDQLAWIGGSCSPSDYEDFNFNTQRAMRPQVKALEDANLVQSTKDDVDKRRKTISMTPHGWLVQYARNDFKIPQE